jgi:hypothetical protein
MKNLTTAIFSKATGSDFLSSVNGRLYKARGPVGAPYPYAVYRVITDVPERTFTERYENYELQFSLFSTASGSTEIETMYNYLKALYDECSLTIAGSTLVWMRLFNTTGAQVEDWVTPDGTEEVWAIHASFEIYTSLE